MIFAVIAYVLTALFAVSAIYLVGEAVLPAHKPEEIYPTDRVFLGAGGLLMLMLAALSYLTALSFHPLGV